MSDLLNHLNQQQPNDNSTLWATSTMFSLLQNLIMTTTPLGPIPSHLSLPQPGGGIEDTSTDENDNKHINVIADENQELVLDTGRLLAQQE
jgi:hypothetical protein